LFKYNDSDYAKLAAVKLENGFPIALNFSYDSQKIVVCTNQRKLILLDPVTFQLKFKPEDLSVQFWNQWIGRYPLVTKSTSVGGLMPVCLGHRSNMIVAGDENGNVYVWRDAESVKDHIGVNLTGHASSVQRLGLTEDDKKIITLGANDCAMFQWKIASVERKDIASDGESKIVLKDVSLINELNFCYVHQ
jgi:WD40 repeat protein